MVDVAKLDELIARVEKATGGDGELDRDVAIALGWAPPTLGLHHWHDDLGNHWSALPDWSTSVDDALGLVEQLLPGWCWKLVSEGGRRIFVLRNAPKLEVVGPAWVASDERPCLAIIHALLRALRESSEKGR